MTKNRKCLRGTRVPASKCLCGRVIHGFWCKDTSYYKPTDNYICNACYDKKIRPVNRVLPAPNEHLAMWSY